MSSLYPAHSLHIHGTACEILMGFPPGLHDMTWHDSPRKVADRMPRLYAGLLTIHGLGRRQKRAALSSTMPGRSYDGQSWPVSTRRRAFSSTSGGMASVGLTRGKLSSMVACCFELPLTQGLLQREVLEFREDFPPTRKEAASTGNVNEPVSRRGFSMALKR